MTGLGDATSGIKMAWQLGKGFVLLMGCDMKQKIIQLLDGRESYSIIPEMPVDARSRSSGSRPSILGWRRISSSSSSSGAGRLRAVCLFISSSVLSVLQRHAEYIGSYSYYEIWIRN